MIEKEFSTAALLSITTGILLEDFSLVHEAAEFVLGQPIMTHQFGSKKVVNALKSAVLEQHPDLHPELGNGIDKSNWKEKVEVLIQELGEKRIVKKGEKLNPFGIFEGIPKDKPVIFIETGNAN